MLLDRRKRLSCGGLYKELPYAAMRAAETLRTDGTTMRGDDLLPFWRADNAVTEIIGRINEILNIHTPRR